MKNLIFIEGISGVGKSATTTALCEKINNLGYTVNCYLEGDASSPLDLFGVAYLTKTEYENLLLSYPSFADKISENSIIASNYALMRYKTTLKKFYSPELYEHLKKCEFCLNPVHPVSLIAFTEVFSDLWRRFAESEQTKPDCMILDGSFLHHQINDLIRNYNASEDEIIKHLIELIKMVRAFNPVVFYLSAKDIGERLAKVSNSRGKNAPTNEDVVFWQNRNDTDLRVLRRLPVESHILDITSNNWDAAMDTIISVMENDPVLRHYDALIDENSDPVRDPAILKEYMDKWDGAAFIEALQLSPEKSVLEIGVGTGRLAVRVCDKCRSFTGIDISPKTVDRAKENLQDFANADLFCGDFFNYSSDKAFDVIYSSLTFMHINDKRAAIEKVANLLIPGGRFVLSISKNQQTIIDYGTRQVAVYPDTPEEIALLLNKAGLTIEKQFKTEFAVIFAARKGV